MTQAPATDLSSAEIFTSQASLGGWYGKVGVLLAVILVVPIWAVEYPPLIDYPNHLARGYLLYHVNDDPVFSEYLEIDDRPMPNLAIDFFLLALQPICDVRLAGRLFLTITLWLLLAGWHLLGCAIHGKPTWLALGAALIAYHSMFLWGFINFSFGLGMFVLAAAAWLHWRANWVWWRLLLMAVLALGCYFSHLAALVFLAGTALAVTSWDALQQKRITGAMIVGLLPVLLPFGFFLRGGGSGDIQWKFLLKLVGALCLFRGYNRHADAVFIAAVAIFLILLGVWSTRVRANAGVLFAGLGCVFMFLVGPYEIFGGAPGDARFIPAAAALVTLSLDLTLPRKKALTLLGLFMVLVVFRYGMIGAYWQSFQRDLRQQVELFQAFPEHAKVYPMVFVSEQPEQQKQDLVSFHMIHYAVMDRHIYSPHLFAFAGQQPINYKTPPIAFHSNPHHFPVLTDDDWNKIFATYDYLWCWNLPDAQRLILQRHCTVVDEKGNGTIWRVMKAP